MMKGPNAPLPVVDLFLMEVTPQEWNNIPLPLVRTINHVKDVFSEFKKMFFEQFNDNVSIKKAVNINQAQSYHDAMHVKEELLENNVLMEGRVDGHMVDLETRFKLLLQTNHDTLEGKMRDVIDKKIEE